MRAHYFVIFDTERERIRAPEITHIRVLSLCMVSVA